jgi:hypothetical protein
MVTFFDELADRARARPLDRLAFEARKYQVDHVGSVAPSFRDGLEHLFTHGFGGTP